MNVEIQLVEGKRFCTLKFSGILDYSTMDTFIEKVRSIKTDTKNVVIDFTELEFIDSTGIGAIINLVHEANEKDFLVELVGISPENEALFNMIGVFDIIETLQNRE